MVRERVSSRRPRQIACIVVGTAVLLWLLTLDGPPQHRPSNAPASRSSGVVAQPADLIYYARYAVRESLKSPSSAEFPTVSSGRYGVRQLAASLHEVTGEVEADNAFGAHLRQPWVVQLKQRGGEWNAVYIQIGDQVVYNSIITSADIEHVPHEDREPPPSAPGPAFGNFTDEAIENYRREMGQPPAGE